MLGGVGGDNRRRWWRRAGDGKQVRTEVGPEAGPSAVDVGLDREAAGAGWRPVVVAQGVARVATGEAGQV